MIIELDMSSSTPIYVQLRNQIVKGIGKGELKTGEKLPTVRQLASDASVNTMTVNKAYQILKNEGFIRTDRRLGAFVSESIADDTDFTEKLESELELLSAEACLTGMSREEFYQCVINVFTNETLYRLAEEADYGNYHVYYLYSYKPFYHTMYAICVHTRL